MSNIIPFSQEDINNLDKLQEGIFYAEDYLDGIIKDLYEILFLSENNEEEKIKILNRIIHIRNKIIFQREKSNQ